MKRFLFSLLMLFCVMLFAGAGPAVEMDYAITLNPLGDANYKIEFKLTAAAYAQWFEKYGKNKSLLRRDLESKIVSQFDTSDWKVEIAEMERRVTVTFKALGVVSHRGGGLYQSEIPKNWKGGQQNGNTLDYNFVESMDSNAVLHINAKLILPPGATNAKEGTGESGERVLRYNMPYGSSKKWLFIIPGVLAVFAGAGLVLFGLLPGKSAK